MFEPLKRGPALENRAKVDDGLGLGLFIVREIVRAHGGEIDARSENKEIVFAVRLPRDQARSNRDQEIAPAAGSSREPVTPAGAG